MISDMTSHRAGRTVPRIVVLLVGSVLLLGACTNVTDVRRAGFPTGSPPALPSPRPLSAVDTAQDPIVAVVQRVAPSVVNVTTSLVSTDAITGATQPGRAVGTGFIVRGDGVIVTNFHVVEGATHIRVTLPPPNGHVFAARVIGGDPEHDLAVLKVNATALPTVPLGDSSKLLLGERVIALGYALALPGGPTVTSGIISALGRTVQAQDPEANNGQGLTRTYQNVLQTDAAINPGNSGGPLVDLAGNVVGINTAGINAGAAENVGFSIAINAARTVILDAMQHPDRPTAYMGVISQPLDAGLAAQLGLPVKKGALVVALSPGGPAAKTTLAKGDVIVEFDGTAIASPDDLGAAIDKHRPGDEVTVAVVGADGNRFDITLSLGTRPLPTNP
jgi:serine protease Do